MILNPKLQPHTPSPTDSKGQRFRAVAFWFEVFGFESRSVASSFGDMHGALSNVGCLFKGVIMSSLKP